MTGWTVPPGLAFDNHAERLEACVFTVVCDVLDAAVVAAKERIERLYQTDTGEAASRKSPTDTYHLENLPNKGQLFETFFLNPAILKLAERFLGAQFIAQFIAQDVWSFGILPGTLAYHPHADDDVRTPGTPLSMVMTYPLVDFTPDNGGTRVVPGSHWIPHYPKRSDCSGETNINAPTGPCVALFGSRPHLLSVSAERSVFEDLVLASVEPAPASSG